MPTRDNTAMRPLYREFATQAQFDAQYNPSIALADPAAPGRHFTALAAQTRERLRCILDVPFGPTLDETLDIFPADAPNAPVFVFIHGGYWRALSSKEFSWVAMALQPMGITTVVTNYALCPRVTIDEITRQTRAALAWTLRHIQDYGGNPHRIAIGGHSAGGHLTAMALQTAWQADYGLPQDPFAAAVLFSGLYDIEPLRYSYLQPQIQLDDRTIRHHSPAFSVRACQTPVWITWGDCETTEFARQSALLHRAWRDAGNTAELAAMAGADHFSVIAGFEDGKSAVCRWLGRHLLDA